MEEDRTKFSLEDIVKTLEKFNGFTPHIATIDNIIDDFKKMAEERDEKMQEKLERSRKAASYEISTKLMAMKEICTLQNKLKEIPFYKFFARSEIKFKILELQSELQYGRLEKISE